MEQEYCDRNFEILKMLSNVFIDRPGRSEHFEMKRTAKQQRNTTPTRLRFAFGDDVARVQFDVYVY